MSNNQDNGNAAAMREALIKIQDICQRVGKDISPLSKRYKSRECQTINRCFRNAVAALSAPLRNCDVGTAEEQEDRFFVFCKVHECTINCPIKKKWNFTCGHKPSCALLWAQMPYEKGDAE